MSFKATFKIEGGNEYRILSCSYDLQQEIDNTGRPSSTTRGGMVHLVVESTDDTSLFEWACDSYMRNDGSITFNKRDADSKMKVLEIKEAYLISYNESFDNAGSGAMIESLSLSAKSIKLGNGEHENEWAM